MKKIEQTCFLIAIVLLYTEMNSKVGDLARRHSEFESSEAGAEAAKLKKFSDAGGSQIQRLPDDAKA